MGLLNIIRRMALREKLSVREISRRTGLSRNTIAKYLSAGTIEPKFAVPERASKLDPFADKLSGWLRTEAGRPRKQRRTLKQLHADLMVLGFTGSYGRVAAFAREWRVEQQTTGRGIFVPLSFRPGEAFQFDWSEDSAVIGGERTKLQVAHIKLAHSRAFLVRAYLLQTHEMLFDAHWHGFRVFGGVPGRGIYDNMKTAVDRVGRGKERQVNVRFLAMTNHYVFAPEFCNPAAGWEKGQVEKNVQDARPRLWQQMPDFPDLVTLNLWLEQRCQDLWRETLHGTLPGTIADVWADERTALMALPAAFDGFVEQSKRVSPTCLITFERNRYSVPASFANRPSACGSIPNGWSLRLRAISSASMYGSSTEAITGHQRRFTIGGITLQSSSASLERYAMVRPLCNCRQPYDNCRIRCFAAPAVIVRWSIFLPSFFIMTSKSSSRLWNSPWMRAWRPRPMC